MPKNILVFSDGTGQAGGIRPDQRLSNVYKLYRATRSGTDSHIDPAEQITFYDAGLGSTEIAGPFWKQPMELARKLLSSATGTGFSRNVIDCYEAILKFYEPGDRVYLFGFSRGAYTVRTVAGVMNLCGVPTKDKSGAPLPRHGRKLREIAAEAVQTIYEHGAGYEREVYEDEREEKGKRFRAAYGTQDDPVKNERGDVVPYFIGVFDTVAALGTSGMKRIGILALTLLIGVTVAYLLSGAVGDLFGIGFWHAAYYVIGAIILGAAWLYSRAHYREITDWPEKGATQRHFAGWKSKHYDRFLDPRVRYGRHAQAIDETRRDFARVGWGSSVDAKNNPKDWLVQKWFAGNHSDIGGSYPENESRLSDVALTWMVHEATKIPNPIIIDSSNLNLYPDPSGMQHCEVVSVRESYPKWWPMRLRLTWKEEIRPKASLAGCLETVFERVRMPSVAKLGEHNPYRPEALMADNKFIKLVKALDAKSKAKEHG